KEVSKEVSKEVTNEVEIGVRVESPAPEAVTCPVRFDRAVSPGGTSLFETPEEARAWPAVHALLGIQGVHSIIGKGDALVIARHGSAEWAEILEAIEPALQRALAEVGTVRVQLPAVVASPSVQENSGSPSGTTSEASDSENALRGRVAQVIEEKINPAVASHGGHIDLLDVQGSRVFIHMGGGCQGCAMSAATLKHGVETTLRAEIPEITEILDTTDHASGANPFFAS
ncbi:MAG: NifU family protein, partial [Myxococcota bacterium]|nr:NifU family protein [Myxococcota bacterium]